jgi:hypothetical protein
MTEAEQTAADEAAYLAGQFFIPLAMSTDRQAEVSCLRLANLIKHVRELERSECAKVCESTYPELVEGQLLQMSCFDTPDDCAAAIRARSWTT